jgi:hypothetical protein
MPKTKGAASATDKWQRRASAAGQDYVAGINNPRVPWDQAAKAGAANYKLGVTAAANSGRYETGIGRVGNQAWVDGATKKGPGRFAEGVSFAAPKFENRIATVISAIEGVTLPPRGPKGSPQNFNRVAPIGAALRRAFGKDK